jgi:hypothetical protein
MLPDRGTSDMKLSPGRSIVAHPTEIGVGKAECAGSGIQTNGMTVAGITYIFCHVCHLGLKGKHSTRMASCALTYGLRMLSAVACESILLSSIVSRASRSPNRIINCHLQPMARVGEPRANPSRRERQLHYSIIHVMDSGRTNSCFQ